MLAAYAAGRTGTWGIVARTSGRVVGTVTLVSVDQGDRRAEIGHALARPSGGRDDMTEAVRAVHAFGFEALGVNRIEAMCEAPNVASARVMEKVGMRYEGTLRQYLFSRAPAGTRGSTPPSARSGPARPARHPRAPADNEAWRRLDERRCRDVGCRREGR